MLEPVFLFPFFSPDKGRHRSRYWGTRVDFVRFVASSMGGELLAGCASTGELRSVAKEQSASEKCRRDNDMVRDLCIEVGHTAKTRL